MLASSRYALPVTSKKDFVERYIRGEFGNRSPTWNSLEEFCCSTNNTNDYDDLYHLRNRVVIGGATFYNQRRYELIDLWRRMDYPLNWYCSCMVPKLIEERLLIQGEVQQSDAWSGHCGLDLYYSKVPKPMRISLLEGGSSCSGIIAKELLGYYLCSNSYEWLNELLNRYPGHVVEFSSYEKEWGVIPRYNTVFWEVRLY